VRVERAWVAVVLSVIVVVLATARGITAPRRTMRLASAVGMQDSVVVDFLVTVLNVTLLTVTELFGAMVVVRVLDGSREIVVFAVMDAPLGVIELVMTTVEPWLTVIEVGLGEDVSRMVRVVVPLMVEVVAALVVTTSVTVSLRILLLVIGSGVSVRPSSVNTSVDVDVTSGDFTSTVAVALSVLVLTTSAPVIEMISVVFRTLVSVISYAGALAVNVVVV
jgi:hypothetical protein